MIMICKSLSFICILSRFNNNNNNNKCFSETTRIRLFIFQIITNCTRPLANEKYCCGWNSIVKRRGISFRANRVIRILFILNKLLLNSNCPGCWIEVVCVCVCVCGCMCVCVCILFATMIIIIILLLLLWTNFGPKK